jgi:8-oxo-dGTP pyrophosphatase MutT (NUDIX family)
MRILLDQIRQALAGHQPRLVEPQPHHLGASVALVLAGADDDLSLCLIRRAERLGDPWSGHLALPGGHADAGDPNPQAVAQRETLEEVGLELGPRHYLGGLSQVPVRLGPADRQLILSPFVYYLGPALAPLAGSDEVAEAFWQPLTQLWDPANASSVPWQRDGRQMLYPAIRCRGQVLWGLTLRVLTLFSDVLDAPLPHLEEIPSM